VRERLGVDGAALAADDGIVVRIPDSDAEPPGAELFLFDADELDQIVTAEVGGSALFAARFREAAARALLLPRRDPGRRSPLWQQRQRASQLLDVARKFPGFPIILETVREVLKDVYDLPALLTLTARIAQRTVRLVESETAAPSPFARSLLFGYIAAFLYEGDSPLAERRTAALSIDPTLLSELLGRAELRELLDPDVIARTEEELQRLSPDRRTRDPEGVVDLLRMLGPLNRDEIAARVDADQLGAPLDTVLSSLIQAVRVLPVTIAGRERFAAVEDASRLRDALGVALPIGVPAAYVEPVADPVGDLISRFARTHGPFEVAAAAERFGLGPAVVTETLRRLAADRRVVDGEFRPGFSGIEWVSVEVLRRLRSRSLAALRREVEPVEQSTFARFLPAWQHVGGLLRGVDGVAQVVEQLAGVALPASAWESLVLPARIPGYAPAMLDELTVAGEIIWAGAGSLAGGDGWVSLHLADSASLTLPEPAPDAPAPSELQAAILDALGGGGAYFFRQLGERVGADDATLGEALWDLVWAGLVTNDSLAPLRARLGGPTRVRAPRARAGRRRSIAVAQAGPPIGAGRWSLVPHAQGDPTVRAKATAELLLERHGVVTRGAVVSEGVRGGFGLLYRVLSGFEEQGRTRRGYFVSGLGAAQFATGPTVDRLRSFTRDPDAAPRLEAVCLAATDPANAFGAALPWPASREGTGHRPGRKAGALVVLVDGELAVFVERGGKSVLTFDDDPAVLHAAATRLAETARSLGRMRVERIDGEFGVGTPFGAILVEAGFAATPQGLRLRAG
jgi:ATP-dependent Lhr-like helicase